jgi:hypothetical protein
VYPASQPQAARTAAGTVTASALSLTAGLAGTGVVTGAPGGGGRRHRAQLEVEHHRPGRAPGSWLNASSTGTHSRTRCAGRHLPSAPRSSSRRTCDRRVDRPAEAAPSCRTAGRRPARPENSSDTRSSSPGVAPPRPAVRVTQRVPSAVVAAAAGGVPAAVPAAAPAGARPTRAGPRSTTVRSAGWGPVASSKATGSQARRRSPTTISPRTSSRPRLWRNPTESDGRPRTSEESTSRPVASQAV